MSFWARWASAPMLCIIHVVHPATIGNLRDHRRGLLQPRLSFEIRVVQTLAVGTSSEKIAKSAAHGVASASKVTALAHQRTHFGKEKFHNPSKFISVSSVNAVETAEARSSDIHRCRKLVAIVVDTGKGNDTPLGLSILYQHHRILVIHKSSPLHQSPSRDNVPAVTQPFFDVGLRMLGAIILLVGNAIVAIGHAERCLICNHLAQKGQVSQSRFVNWFPVQAPVCKLISF
mmetsp:Transcript_60098/g.131656  ORF Transcript_60098/g.131656 Transcript_60098/m.131656 type:complete len:231 (+) Transcript_60098:176-868(+)